ncbi:hypothetical protein D3C71_1142400 [compost metagenome]
MQAAGASASFSGQLQNLGQGLRRDLLAKGGIGEQALLAEGAQPGIEPFGAAIHKMVAVHQHGHGGQAAQCGLALAPGLQRSGVGQQAGRVGVVDAPAGQDVGRGQGRHRNTRHRGARQGDGALQVARAAGLQVGHHVAGRIERGQVGGGGARRHPDHAARGAHRTCIELRPRHAAQACLHAGMWRIHPHQRSARQRALQLLGLCRVQHRWATQRVVDMHKAQTRLGGQTLHHGRAWGGGDVGGEPEQHGRRLRGLHQRCSQKQAPQCRAQNQRLHGLAGSAAPAPASAGATPVSGM